MNILPTGFEPVISTVRGWRHNRTRLREHSAEAIQSRKLFRTKTRQFAHAWNRTKNLQLRRLSLYPIELHEHD